MKSLYRFQAITIVFLFMMSVAVSAQQNNRHKHDTRRSSHESCSNSSERQQERVRHQDKSTYYRQNNYHHRDKREKRNRNHAHNYSKKYSHHHETHRHYPVYNRPEVRYVRCLPSRHYTRMHIGNEAYYYCNGQFYAYHAGCGYHLVDMRFQTVSHLPRHCEVRVVDGRRFYYKDGHCYMPHADGHYRVFNISVML